METQEIGFAAKTEAAKNLIATASQTTVSTRQEHQSVGLLVDSIRALEKELEAEYEGLIIVQEARRIQKIKGALSRDLEDARKTAKGRMIEFEKLLELERVQAERAAQAESKRLADEAALAAALEAEQAGDAVQAEAIIQEPVVAAVVVVPQEKLKVAGHSRRKIYKARIVNPSLVPDEYWCLDTQKIESVIRAKKQEGEGVIPGVLAYSETV